MSPVSRLVAVCVSVTLTAIATSAMRAAAAAAGSSVQHRIVSGCVGVHQGGATARGIAGLVLGTMVVHIIAVILGAPITSLIPETLTFSLLIAALTVLPVWISSDHPVRSCCGVLGGARPSMHEAGAMVPALGCAVGAWLGAIPLSLDWEQPWQVWPLPMCVGGLLGYSLGGVSLLAAGGAAQVRRKLARSSDHWSTAAKRS